MKTISTSFNHPLIHKCTQLPTPLPKHIGIIAWVTLLQGFCIKSYPTIAYHYLVLRHPHALIVCKIKVTNFPYIIPISLLLIPLRLFMLMYGDLPHFPLMDFVVTLFLLIISQSMCGYIPLNTSLMFLSYFHNLKT